MHFARIARSIFSNAILASLLLGSLSVNAEKQTQSLYINPGNLQLVDGVEIAYTAFNLTPQFDQSGAVISIENGDTLVVVVENRDSIDHSFAIHGEDGLITIGPGNIDSITYSDLEAPIYRFYDPSEFPKNLYSGLSGVIRVGMLDYSGFIWDLRTHQTEWNDILENGGSPNWEGHDPNYFTINGRSNPDINADPLAKITGNVGDTILIYVANNGLAAHSLHFHGYHVQIFYSDKFPNTTGRSKDTVPVRPGESIILQLVPDKAGEFPVHDHNLVAVSGGNIYPNGMFLTMKIAP